MSEKIVVGMSGGVDSSVAALLLKRQGFDVTGVFMKNWDEQDENGVCTAQEDWHDVQEVCGAIGIPYCGVNFEKAYQERVFADFLRAYRAGRTPNPDVLCNREIKFKAFLHFAETLGASRIATGHFARTDASPSGGVRLLRGVDAQKDQSYFLYMLDQRQLSRAVFPVGGMTKRDVRALAREAGLPVSEKKDSTGVCFIGERNFRRFLQQYLPATPGDMVTPGGEVVGRHEGLCLYTIGQRRGLGIGGRGDGRSWFVVDKQLADNALVVVQGEDHPLLYAVRAEASQCTWIAGMPPMREGEPFRCTAKFRYRQKDQPVTVTLREGRLDIVPDAPQRAVTPGQSVVLYSGETCLGGGILEKARTLAEGASTGD